MNEIVSKFLLAGDTFMPEMHLRQTAFAKNKRVQKFKEREDSIYIY